MMYSYVPKIALLRLVTNDPRPVRIQNDIQLDVIVTAITIQIYFMVRSV
jgi:hypothetical protein